MAHLDPRAVPPLAPTPDDGRRRSSRRPWDESTRPQVPAGPGTWTDGELGAGRLLLSVHDHLRQELAQLRDLVDQVTRGTLDAGAARAGLNGLTMRQNEWTVGAYCASYCRVVGTHHTIEDQSVFPYLAGREPALAPVVERLSSEHHVIHGVLEELDRALVRFVTDATSDALREAIDLLTDALLSHLSYEEHQLLEPLSRHGFAGTGF